MGELASVKRLGWSPYLGKTDSLVAVRLLGRYPVRIQDFWVPAVEAMEQALIEAGYENPCDYIGSYRKRYIAGTTIWSWHSYGGAIDLDYGGDNPDSPDHPGIDKNPHLHQRIYPGFGTDPRFQITEAQVNAVEAIRTVNGKRVWRWLGWSIGDTMHFEPNCSPDDIATGIAGSDDDMATPIPIGTEDPRAENVKWAMFYALGGEWNPALTAADNLRTIPQLDPNPRLVSDSDALVLAGILGTDRSPTSLWPYGAEINALYQSAYAGQPGPPGEVSVFVNGEQVE